MTENNKQTINETTEMTIKISVSKEIAEEVLARFDLPMPSVKDLTKIELIIEP